MSNKTKEHRCECKGCGCKNEAECTDDMGNHLCSGCLTYTVDAYGDVICAKMTNGFERCHVCGKQIDWSVIMTRGPGPNYRVGECGCGEVWREEDRGGWGHYFFCLYDKEDDIIRRMNR